jgi:hypothetical protein
MLAATEWRQLGEVLDTLVPGIDDGLGYVANRVAHGHLNDLSALSQALAGPESALARVQRWCAAPSDSAERSWLVQCRELAWEAFLCDPRWGSNHTLAGWREFGYNARSTSLTESPGDS